MKKIVRSAAIIACAVLGLSFSHPAEARHHYYHYHHGYYMERGELILASQMRLTDLGYFPGRIDGIKGPITSNAIKAFQASNGLPVSGWLTPITLSALLGSDYPYRLRDAAFYQDGFGYSHYVKPAYFGNTFVAGYQDPNGYNYTHYNRAEPIVPVGYYGNAYRDGYYHYAHYNSAEPLTPVVYYGDVYRGTYGAAWHY